MKKEKSLICIVILLIIGCSICDSTYAQEGTWKSYLAEYRNITGPNIIAIAVDSNSTVWFGGIKLILDSGFNNGLSSFNGTNWIQYNIDYLFPKTPGINHIAVDKNNIKWICTNQGLLRYDNINFTRLTEVNSPLDESEIFAAAIDENSNIYLSCENKVLIYNNNNNMQVINIPGLRAYNLKIDKLGVLWIAGGNLGLLRYDGLTLRKFIYTIKPNLNFDVIAIDINNKGEIWAAGNRGFAKFYNDNWIFYNAIIDSAVYNTYWVLCHKDENIYFTCDLGLIKFDGINQELLLPGVGKQPESTNRVIAGKDGTIWLGTQSSGAININNGIWNNFNTSYGLPSNYVLTVIVDKNNQKWFGTNAGLVKFDGSAWRVYNKFNSPLLSNSIRVLRTDSNNSLWIGTGNSGAAKFDGTNWELFTKDNSGIADNIIKCIAIEKDTVWFGTTNGISCFNKGLWKTYDAGSSGLLYNSIRDIAIDYNGVKWIVPSDNSTIISYDGKTWKYFTPGANGWPNTRINCCFVDNQNRKWFGCANGIIVYDDVTPYYYTKSETGINLNEVWTVKQDKLGNLIFGLYWFNGIVIYDGQHWRSYNSTNPLDPTLGISPNYFDIDKHNNKWIASIFGGITVFNENGLILNTTKPNNNLPSDFILFQNYPNPFNGYTKIEYKLDKSGWIKLIIFNSLGEKIYTLINEMQSAGNHCYSFEFKDLPSGVYFYNLSFNSISVAKKMVLLK